MTQGLDAIPGVATRWQSLKQSSKRGLKLNSQNKMIHFLCDQRFSDVPATQRDGEVGSATIAAGTLLGLKVRILWGRFCTPLLTAWGHLGQRVSMVEWLASAVGHHWCSDCRACGFKCFEVFFAKRKKKKSSHQLIFGQQCCYSNWTGC